MGWFENQIEDRREADQLLLEDSFVKAAGVVLGSRDAERISDANIVTKNAIDEVFKYYHYRPVEVPESIQAPGEQLDYCLRRYGMMRREVELKEGWYKNAYGPMLAVRDKDNMTVALLPGKIRGYYYNDPASGRQVRIDSKTAANFRKDATCFYKPLPQKKLGIPDLLLYMNSCFSAGDTILRIVAMLAVTLIGLMMPRLTKALTGPVMASGSVKALIGIAVCMACVQVSTQLITSVSGMLAKRIEIKTSLGVQSSMMMRIMSLPPEFFRRYSPGELKSRAMSVNQLCALMLGMVMTTSLSSVMSLVYILQIMHFARILVIPSLVIILITVAFSTLSTIVQVKLFRKSMDISAKESGMSYSMISGVQKIKLAGAEKRMFARWLDLYSEEAALAYDPPLFIKINGVISTAISLLSTIVMYFLAVESGTSQSSYFAFMSAYGMVMGAFTAMSDIALSAAQIKPMLEMAEPFLTTVPETSGDREIVTDISGNVELDHVSFRYTDDTPYILNDMSIRIKPGEYVAIVGKTGCGKSTLMRLLLGFEKPDKGAVLYDGKDLESLDLPSLRRKVGTVMQNGGLFQGDIYSNIVITAPELTLDDAWKAAEIAGIADDIRDMPMGMFTVISEGSGGISGGQKQRIMIARAVAPGPKLLMFDEATSALDNKTQKQVSEALDAMGCTRIVIAHRLSTIKHCDRILVLDGGHIVEDGTYDELIEKKGFFAELVERQRIDSGEEGGAS
ncbi:MAG: ATP-binding cassette domain-containing protein [Mogibacterium sp.]|nr:ATP-binding cassette domain-containing protein [Mogibacterium sp.]